MQNTISYWLREVKERTACEAWQLARRSFVCATDASLIVTGPWRMGHKLVTTDQILRSKLTGADAMEFSPKSDKDQATWGLCSEHAFASWIARVAGIATYRASDVEWTAPQEIVQGELLARNDLMIPIGATIDWFADIDGRRTIIECKTSKWPQYWKKGPPAKVRAQVIWQQIVSGVDDAIVMACLAGIAPKSYRIHSTLEDMESMVDAVRHWIRTVLDPATGLYAEGRKAEILGFDGTPLFKGQKCRTTSQKQLQL